MVFYANGKMAIPFLLQGIYGDFLDGKCEVPALSAEDSDRRPCTARGGIGDTVVFKDPLGIGNYFCQDKPVLVDMEMFLDGRVVHGIDV